MSKEKSTIKTIEEFINNIDTLKDDEMYVGDYTITLTAEGKTMVLILNGIEVDLIDENEILIHINVLNQQS